MDELDIEGAANRLPHLSFEVLDCISGEWNEQR